MEFIDTHSHLYSSQFDYDRDESIINAINLGIKTILLPNISSKYTKQMLDVCNSFPNNCLPMMGVHPCDITEENFKLEMQHVETQLAKNKYIGFMAYIYFNKNEIYGPFTPSLASGSDSSLPSCHAEIKAIKVVLSKKKTLKGVATLTLCLYN